MLCAPPLCQPASHFLGCFSLRTGAAVVLAGDASYGLSMVVLHSLLLGEVKEPASEKIRESQAAADRRLQAGVGMPAASASAVATGGAVAGQETPWYLQFLDLDIGFGHQLLGLSDQMNIVSGLLYGIVVTGVSLYVLQAVVSGSAKLPSISRMFTSFAHLQILLYVFISLIKLPKLCKPIQKEYLPHLYMECTILWFIYIQRVIIGVVVASFATWVFASFSFVLTFGHGAHTAIDRPDYTSSLDLNPRGDQQGGHDDGYPAKPPMGGGPPGTGGYGPPRGYAGGGGGYRGYEGGGGGGPPRSSMAPPARHNLVGPATHAPSYDHRGGDNGYDRGGPSMSRVPQGGGGQSYNVGRMPRASSSMQTSSTAHSHNEQHPLIKPPVAIY